MCALVLSACASEAPQRSRHVAARPSPRTAQARAAPARPGDVQAPPKAADLVAQAGAFDSFMRRARAIDAGFASPAQVDEAVQAGAAHSPTEVEGGMVAYAALAALQEPRFVAAVRAQQDHAGLARRIAEDPRVVLGLAGADMAGSRAAGALFAQGSALTTEGQKVKRASYSVQHQDWSLATASDHPAELARAKRLGAAGYRPERGDGERVAQSLASAARRGGPASPLVTRGVALAALTVLGEDGRGRGLMSEPRTGSCLKIAKLNYHQCLASAGPHYEDIYCVGQHAMIDPGQCVVEAAQPAYARQASVIRTNYPR